MYSDYGVTFASPGSWSFDNGTARNAINFGVDNSLSYYADNRKNNFLVLDEGLIFRIKESFGSSEKKFSIDVSNANTKFCLSLHYSADTRFSFYKHLHFWVQARFAKGFPCFQSQSCLA